MSQVLTKRDVLSDAVWKCVEEMYRFAQPPVMDLKLAIEEFSKDDKETQRKYPFYSRYYLSQENYNEIKDMYMDAYSIVNPFKDHMDTAIEYLRDGGTKDKWIEGYTDKDGFKTPGHRGYEKVPSIKDQIRDILGDTNDELVDKLTTAVLDTLTECKNFYNYNRHECAFIMGVGDISPTSNKDSVIEYWKYKGYDIEIKDRKYRDDEEEDIEEEDL
jgi:hypothetical protein